MSGLMVPISQVKATDITTWLGAGGIVIVPTETVYGLAIKPNDPSGLERIFRLKGRPRELNLPVIIGSEDQLADLGVAFNDVARRLACRFWPGPLTIVMGFDARHDRPSWLKDRIEVAIRLPAFKLLREVAMIAGPILLTSANGHQTGPKSVAREAVDSLYGEPDYIVDGGTLTSNPSTIINTRVMPACVERLGAIGVDDLAEFLQSGILVERRVCQG